MLKKVIKYTDFDGNEQEEAFYFNLTKAELAEMELSTSGGMEKLIETIINTKDQPKIVSLFKEIILKSYGEKTPDGKGFTKIRNGVPLSEAFSQTAAYSELFMELATDAEAAKNFVNGITPNNVENNGPQDHKKAEIALVQNA